MDRKEFGIFLQNEFIKRFPNGFTSIQLSNVFGLNNLHFSLGMIKDHVNCSGRIRENDPMLHSFYIEFNDNGKIISEINGHSGIYVNPKEQYLAMSRVKTKFRKKTGTIEQQNKHFVKWIDQLVVIFNDHKHDIYNAKSYDKKYFETNDQLNLTK